MIETIYQALTKIGYTHPLHPPATHLPAGLVIGAFVFAHCAWIFNRKTVAQTARHCMILALIMAVPTILLGLMDWQHRFGGAYLFEIKMKLMLAGILLFLLLAAIVYAASTGAFNKMLLAIYALCLATVIGLGYFGGDLVHGAKTTAGPETGPLAAEGAGVFEQNCSACHYTDSAETKLGPGLQGLFRRDKFPSSGQPISDDHLRQILKAPYSKMPAFGHLADEQVHALLAYLKTL